MFSGTGYFKSIDCPFFLSGLCERPYCHFLHKHRLSFSPEPSVAPTASQETHKEGNIPTDAKGHRLYLPPPNAPVYNPTPKALLKTAEKTPPTHKPYIPSSLAQVAALSKPQRGPAPKPPKSKEDVLGDIEDLSSSDEEDKNLDVIGSILLQGVKSGVLGGEVSEFQHELIKNTIKAKNRVKAPPSPTPKKKPSSESNDIVIVISDDEEKPPSTSDKEAEEAEEQKKRILEEERLEAKRILQEKERELEELEKKRQVLENFYKKSGVTPEDSQQTPEDKKHREKQRKSKYKSRKRKRRKYSKKKSKRRRSSSQSYSSYSSSSSSSSSSHSSISSSDSSSSESESERRRRHRRKKHRKHKRSSREHEKKVIDHEPQDIEMHIKTEAPSPENEPPKHLLIKKEEGVSTVDDIKIKKEPPDKDPSPKETNFVPSPSQIKDEDLPESVKSFLDAMEEIDMKLVSEPCKKSSESKKSSRSDSKKSSSSRRSDSKHSSSKSSDSKSRRSSSSSHHKSSSRSGSKSSSSSRKSSHRDSHHSSRSKEESKSRDSKSSSSSSSKSKDPVAAATTSSSLKLSLIKVEPSEASETISKPEEPVRDMMLDKDNLVEEEDNAHYFEDEDSGGEDIFENQDEELRRIFEEHERQVVKQETLPLSKKEHSEPPKASSESLNPKNKKRVAHKVDNEGSSRPPSVRRPMSATQQMLERFKKVQTMRERQEMESRLASMEGDGDPAPQPKLKAGHRILSVPKRTTTATTTKGVARVSHVPTVDISKPLIAPDMKSKVPSGIRQRYLDSLVEECLKIYGGDKGDAYARATKEEQLCCDRSKNRNIYLNVVVNCIKRLRSEASQAPKSKHSALMPQRNMVTSHLQILAGKGGSKGSWSIEKPKSNLNENSPGLAYAILKRYILSKEDFVENGYPVMDQEVKGKAYITQNSQYSNRKPQPPEPDKRRCDRCSALYKVDPQGKQVDAAECIYHWGRLYRQRTNRALGPTSGYYCCNGDANSEGCEVSQTHITDMEDYTNMRGFVSAFSASMEVKDGNYGIFALDCEMCYTTHGNELTRVTVVNYEGETVYEALVKPSRDVIDYNTRFSGISPKDLENVSTSIRDVQAVLLSMISSETILIGHSLESDLKALKLVHTSVVDTSIVFPHKMGPPYKRALKHLAAEHLKRIIQNDVGGHDSAEDALAALDLMKVKVKSDVKKLQQDSSKAKM